MSRIFITRHGESEHNLRTEVFMGRSPDARLTERGRCQARQLGLRLAQLDDGPVRIVASSLPRTLETARLVAAEAGAVVVREIESDTDFWELSKGDWEGRMPRKLPANLSRTINANPLGYRYPGGESYQDVVGRVAPAFERWVERYVGQCLLFVLHGDVIRGLLYHLIGFPGERIADWVIDPCSLTEVRLEAGRRLIAGLNDTAHLS